MTKEEIRLRESAERAVHWKRWGPYLSERAWGTVREDYSPYGTAWEYFPHDHARSRAYRWNEDGIGGFCDRHQHLCLAVAFWNGKDPILKERLFGLTGNEGNHGEDPKECYFYLDSTPTHSYSKMLYKYPQREYPYRQLVEENRRRGRRDFEYDLIETGVFDDNRYFDIFIEYAKADQEDILLRITAWNRGPEAADLWILPTFWARNTWGWGSTCPRPCFTKHPVKPGVTRVKDNYYGERWFICDGDPELLFTENETNFERLFGSPNHSQFVKDAFHEYLIRGNAHAINPRQTGTKMAGNYKLRIEPGESACIKARFCPEMPYQGHALSPIGQDFDEVFGERILEADEFYGRVMPHDISPDACNVMRQAFGGLMWSKQFYHYVVKDWLEGDPGAPSPPSSRKLGRNHQWSHLFNADVISMPDKWEYPWYAAWDLAFHCVPIALVDPDFAKEQLMLMVREWYMHPNGQLPAYEWAFGDVNPPVHAWGAWRVYKIEKKRTGKGDTDFLERIFHKLMLNFTWWVNRKDSQGRNVFEGGFLGLDNIGPFDRSKPVPGGGRIEQADGTGWMAMYTLNLLAIAMELAAEDPTYEDVASKFWEHFLYIAHAINHIGSNGTGMWDEEDRFYYDVLHTPDGHSRPLKVRSIVGMIPLFAVETLDMDIVKRLKGFKRRMDWFLVNRKDLTGNVASMELPGAHQRRLLSIAGEHQLRCMLKALLDETEFLSPYGIRALSRVHKDKPFVMKIDGAEYRVDYEPAESTTGLFGGNSNWRGPIWFPINYLLIESLQKFHFYYGDEFKVECPTGSGRFLNLYEVAGEISRRLSHLFLRDPNGRRAINGGEERFAKDPHWRDLVLFHEYFHGDNGAGLGAPHQTGWTALVAKLLQQSGE
jgi:hypothetical protein